MHNHYQLGRRELIEKSKLIRCDKNDIRKRKKIKTHGEPSVVLRKGIKTEDAKVGSRTLN